MIGHVRVKYKTSARLVLIEVKLRAWTLDQSLTQYQESECWLESDTRARFDGSGRSRNSLCIFAIERPMGESTH